MQLSCTRTVALHTHPAPAGGGAAWLRFLGSGLLIEVQGAAARLEGRPGHRRVELGASEAHGLGLTAADFAQGVALCVDEEGPLGWRCESVAIQLLDTEGQTRVIASSADAARWLE